VNKKRFFAKQSVFSQTKRFFANNVKKITILSHYFLTIHAVGKLMRFNCGDVSIDLITFAYNGFQTLFAIWWWW